MKKKSPVVIVSSLLVIIFFLLELLLYREISFLYTTNIFFYPAAFFLIIGSFSLIVRSGSFDVFYYSMKNFTRKLKKNDPEEEDDHSVSYLSNTYGAYYLFFIKVGMVFLTISLIALAGYYLFQ